MIQIHSTNYSAFLPLFLEFASKNPRLQNLTSAQVEEQLKKGFERKDRFTYAVTNEIKEFIAFGVISIHDTYEFAWGINFIYSNPSNDPNFMYRKKLVNELLEFLQPNPDITIITISGLIDFPEKEQYYEKLGFTPYDRYSMRVSLNKIKKIIINTLETTPNFDETVQLVDWDEKFTEQTIHLCIDYEHQNVDSQIFPYFQNTKCTSKFMELLKHNQWGKFLPETAFVVLKDEIPVGVCFITEMQPDFGYIPYICIHPDHAHKGYGRFLLRESLLKAFKKKPEWKTIGLDVTCKNYALNLYTSLGFEETRRYTMWSMKKALK